MGLFENNARRIAYVLREHADEYFAKELPFVHPVTSQVVSVVRKKVYVSALTTDDNGVSHLEVASQDDCDQFSLIHDSKVDARLRDVVVDEGNVTFAPLATTTSRWLSYSDDENNGFTLVNYDGFSLRKLVFDITTRQVNQSTTRFE